MICSGPCRSRTCAIMAFSRLAPHCGRSSTGTWRVILNFWRVAHASRRSSSGWRSHSKSTWSDKTNEGVYLNFESLASAEGGGHITPTSVQSAKRIAESCIQAGGDMVHVHPQSGQREYLYIKKKVRDGQRDCWSLTKEEQSLPKRPRERSHGDHGGAGPTSQQLQVALAMPHNDMEKEVSVSDASSAGRKQQPAAKRARKKDVEEHEEGGSQKKNVGAHERRQQNLGGKVARRLAHQEGVSDSPGFQ